MKEVQLFQLADTLLMAFSMGLDIRDRATAVRARMHHLAKEGAEVPDEEWRALIAQLGVSDEIIEDRARAARAAMGQAEGDGGNGN